MIVLSNWIPLGLRVSVWLKSWFAFIWPARCLKRNERMDKGRTMATGLALLLSLPIRQEPTPTLLVRLTDM